MNLRKSLKLLSDLYSKFFDILSNFKKNKQPGWNKRNHNDLSAIYLQALMSHRMI